VKRFGLEQRNVELNLFCFTSHHTRNSHNIVLFQLGVTVADSFLQGPVLGPTEELEGHLWCIGDS
jgi:hypothetical protein